MYKPTKKRWIFSTLGAGILCPLLSPAFLFLVTFQSIYALFHGDEGVGIYLAGGIMFAYIAGFIPGVIGASFLAIVTRLRWHLFEGAKKCYWLVLGGGIGFIFSVFFILIDLEMTDINQAFLITANNVFTGMVTAYFFRHLLLGKREI